MCLDDRCLARRMRLLLLLLLVVGSCAVARISVAADEAGPAAPPRYQQPVLIEFEGMITPMLEQFLERQLATARERGADLVVIRIDSPGGLVDPSFSIARRLRDVDWAATVAFIPERALSGAAVVAMGCDQIFMHPDAHLGDVGVIMMGEDRQFRYVEEKVRTHVSSQLRSLAESQGRPPALVEAMVDMDLVVYQVTNRQTGRQTYMSEQELAASPDPDDWERGPVVFESREKSFLEVTGTRAVELGLAEGTAGSVPELLRQLRVDNEPLVLAPTAVDTAVFILNLPLVTGLLFVVGLVALYVEFSAPGISVGGLIALLCFTLFFWSRFLGGTAQMLEVLLFISGVLFLAAEIFVLPGFGVAGISGLLLMTAAVVMASQDFVVPQTPRQVTTLSTSLLVLTCSGLGFLLIAGLLSRYFGSLPILNRLALNPPDLAAQEADGAGKAKLAASESPGPGVGDWGLADSPLRPSGRARFGDDILDVITDGVYVDAGRPIRIVEMQGSRILVAEVEDGSTA